MFSEIFSQHEDDLEIVEMYDPVALFSGGKPNIKNSEFVVIYKGRETVMTRDSVIKTSPRALIKWYESKLAFRGQK